MFEKEIVKKIKTEQFEKANLELLGKSLKVFLEEFSSDRKLSYLEHLFLIELYDIVAVVDLLQKN